MRNVILYLLLLFNVLPLFAQKPKAADEMLKINQFYLKNRKITMNAEFRFFRNAYDKTPFLAEKANIATYENLSNYSTTSKEIINGKDYYLYVNHTGKEILIAGQQTSTPQFSPEAYLSTFNELLKSCRTYKTGDDGKDSRYCFLFFDSKHIQEFRIWYTASYAIKKMVLIGESLPGNGFAGDESKITKIEIIYSNINTSPKFTKNLFDYSRYLSHYKGNFVATKSYEKYAVRSLYIKK